MDSIFIENRFADNPFSFEHLTISSFLQNIQAPVRSTRQAIESRQGDDIRDTIITFTWDSSRVSFIRSPYLKNALMDYAEIRDTNILFRNGVRTGMPLDEICWRIPDLPQHLRHIYFIELHYGDGTNYVRLYFKNDVLQVLLFLPYTG